MAHEFDRRIRDELDQETTYINPELVNYMRLLRKVGKIEYRAKINRYLILTGYGLAIVLIILTELDRHIHL